MNLNQNRTGKKKALLYFLFVFIANVFTQIGQIYAPVDKHTPAPAIYYILTLIGFIAVFIPTGYGISCIKAIREQGENIILPFLNIKHNFISGFKMMLGITILSITLGILYMASLIIPAIILALFNLKAVMAVLMIALSLIMLLLVTVYSPAMCCLFAEKEWITTFFRLIRATKAIKENAGNYFKYVGLFIIFMIVFSIINSIIMVIFNNNIGGAVFTALLISLISTYTAFVFAYIAAKSVTAKSFD